MTVAALSRARQSTLSRGINAFVQRSHDVGGILPNGPATSWPLHDAAPTTARCSTLGQFQETPGPSWLRLRTGGSRSRRATASDAHLALTPIAPQRKIAGAGAWGYHGQYVAFDGTSFFLAGNGPLLYEDLRAGFLARVSVSDGTVTMLGSMEDAQAVAVDDQCVYWASDSGLFSLSKTTSQTFALDGVPPPTAPDAGVSANPSLDGGRRRRLLLFAASSYDQSCVADGDCVEVYSIDDCSNRTCLCSGDPISVAGRAQFNADIAKTSLGSGALQPPPCSCPTPLPPPCCRAGMCTRACSTLPSMTSAR